jgi:hypothetical protein
MAPKKARKEAKEGREGNESSHNRKEEGKCAEIFVSGKLRTLYNHFYYAKVR